jgi:hypothetical protein
MGSFDLHPLAAQPTRLLLLVGAALERSAEVVDAMGPSQQIYLNRSPAGAARGVPVYGSADYGA